MFRLYSGQVVHTTVVFPPLVHSRAGCVLHSTEKSREMMNRIYPPNFWRSLIVR